MLISGCIGFKDRDERYLAATISNMFEQGVDEVMLCNFGAEGLSAFHNQHKLYHIHIPLDRWRLGLAFNICAIHAAGDVLVLMNGGIIMSEGALADSLSLLKPGKQYVSPLAHYYRCAEATTMTWFCNREFDLKRDAQLFDSHFAGDGDFVLIARDDYLRLGGHDSEMQGWGRENRCFHARAQEHFTRVRGIGALYHLEDGYPMSRQHEDDYKINDLLLKSKKAWWRNELR